MTAFVGLFLLLAAWPADTNAPVAYRHEQRQQPRPLHIHILRVDLRNPGVTLQPVVATDPDGDGPAEARLEDPVALAARAGVVAAVNANAFNTIPPLKPGQKAFWVRDLPVTITGWAQHGPTNYSPPQKVSMSLWQDPTGRGRVEPVSELLPARMAVAGFQRILRDNQNVAGTNDVLNPRTAAGVDREGRTLWLMVVDGRQPGYSEGVAVGELAALMKEVGSWDALNLDGGGSSIMLLATNGANLEIMNRPSGFGPRPLPVMLGIKSGASATRH